MLYIGLAIPIPFKPDFYLFTYFFNSGVFFHHCLSFVHSSDDQDFFISFSAVQIYGLSLTFFTIYGYIANSRDQL